MKVYVLIESGGYDEMGIVAGVYSSREMAERSMEGVSSYCDIQEVDLDKELEPLKRGSFKDQMAAMSPFLEATLPKKLLEDFNKPEPSFDEVTKPKW